ncbi:hypothetical protein BGX27_005389 [Mortierella sp. AM989]|nr:hypothetical protein BGX27_005389 [Mortierella sp. AM989]
MKRIPPQRARATVSQPRSLNTIQNRSKKERSNSTDIYSYGQNKCNNPQPTYRSSESSQRQHCDPSNDNGGVAHSSRDASDDDFAADSRKTRRIEDQPLSDPQRHLSSPALHQALQSSGKKSTKGLQTHQAQTDYDATLDENWPTFPDQIDFDYKLDSDSSLGSSPFMKAIRNAPSALSTSDANHDTIDDIDKLLMEDDSPPELAPTSQSFAGFSDTKSRVSIPEAKALEGKKTESEDKGIHVDKDAPRKSVSISERGLKTCGDESRAKDREPEVQANIENQPTDPQNTDLNQAQDQAICPQIFDVPATSPDFKTRLDGLNDRFATCLGNMVQAVQDVDSLHDSVKEAIESRQSYLVQRGMQLHARMQDLHKEAGLLHSKATKDLKS